ncbi:MAG: hypothetical protein AMXMBFR84_38060 [Candidatus Hydrogenedentota bacterium]
MTEISALLSPGFDAVLRLSLQAGALVLLILLLQWALKKHLTARWRHALWGLLLLRLAIPYSILLPVSLTSVTGTALEEIPILNPIPSPLSSHKTDPILNSPGPENSPVSEEISYVQLIPLLWLFGWGVAGAILLIRYSLFRRNLSGIESITEPDVLRIFEESRSRLGVRRSLSLVTGPPSMGPALAGLLHTRLIVPPDLLHRSKRDHLKYVLLHELAHAKRHDLLVGWAFDLLSALHWFNPLLALAKRRMASDRELACDAHVLSHLHPEERTKYGHTLLDEYQLRRPLVRAPGLAAVLEGKTNIERRIAMVSNYTKPRRIQSFIAFAALASISTIGFTGITASDKSEATVSVVGAADSGSSVPDLEILPEDIAAFTTQGGDGRLLATVRNHGPSDQQVSVAFHRIEQADTAGSDNSAGAQLVELSRETILVPANGSASSSFRWRPKAGMHSIRVTLDPDNNIHESNRGNNEALCAIACYKDDGKLLFGYGKKPEQFAIVQAPKIVVVDTKKLSESSPWAEKTKAHVEQLRSVLQSEIDELADEIKRLKETHPEQVEEKLNTLRIEVRKMQAHIDIETSAYARELQLRFANAAKAIGEREGYLAIVDSNRGTLAGALWIQEGVAIPENSVITGPDITPELTKVLLETESNS